MAVIDLSSLKKREPHPDVHPHWYVEFLENSYEIMPTGPGMEKEIGKTWVAMVTNANNKGECYVSRRSRPMAFNEVKVWVGQVIESEAFRENLKLKARRAPDAN